VVRCVPILHVSFSSTIAGFSSFCPNHIICLLLVYSARLSVCIHFACLSTPWLSCYPSPKSLCHLTSVLFSVQNSYTSLFCLCEDFNSSLSQYINHHMTRIEVCLFVSVCKSSDDSHSSVPQYVNQTTPTAVCLST
jgi:hypothetical protein